MTRVVNIFTDPYDVYIGRRRGEKGKWGNPFIISKDGTRNEVIEKYRKWIVKQPEVMAALPELAGKTLGCFCKPFRCHGDVLIELLKEMGIEE